MGEWSEPIDEAAVDRALDFAHSAAFAACPRDDVVADSPGIADLPAICESQVSPHHIWDPFAGAALRQPQGDGFLWGSPPGPHIVPDSLPSHRCLTEQLSKADDS